MHIPDGILDAKTALAASALAGAGLALAVRRVRLDLPPRRMPLLGLSASFLFAAQMINFPVAGGTSGHLIGGTLVAVLLGPSAAIVVLTTVLMVQCLLFADGGLLALGANVFNMGVVASVGGYAVYALLRRVLPGLAGRLAAVAFAGWCSTVLAAVACAGELAWSGATSWRAAFSAMAGIHSLIGLGEGAISAMVVVAIARTRADLLERPAAGARGARIGEFAGYALLVSLGLAVFVAPFACPWPDGLERAAQRIGLTTHAVASPLPAPLAEYQVPWLGSSVVSTALAGGIGCGLVLLLALGFSRILSRQVRPVAAPSRDRA